VVVCVEPEFAQLTMDELKKMQDKKKMWSWVTTHKSSIALWTGLVVFVVFVYHLVSDGDFSFLLTLGGICRMFAFLILLFRIYTQKTASGVSLKTLEMYAGVFFFRLCSILFYEGYLPFDKSGDWFYQFNEFLALALVSLNIFMVGIKHKASYNKAADGFGSLKVPSEYGIVWLVVPCLLIALVFHPSLNANFLTDTSWCFALWLEAVAILPQLLMFQWKGGEVEAFTANFVSALGLARFIDLVFWLSSYHELNDKFSEQVGGAHVGHMVVLSQVIQLMLMVDYFYYYIKALNSGGPMLLPSSMNAV
jgi:hypothetical protein